MGDGAKPPSEPDATWLATGRGPRAITRPGEGEAEGGPAGAGLDRTQPVPKAEASGFGPGDETLLPEDVERRPPRPSSHATRPEGASASWGAAHLPPLPERIGRFEIHGRLGAGGMGMVFEGRDATLDRRVAVKLLRLDEGGSQSDEGSARLLREAQALARLSHPNVIQVYEVGTWQGQVFVAMEFIDGVDFERWQADPELSWAEVLRAYLQAGRGLVAAHEAGIVHRDFKPSNVMRGHDGRVVVLDFGLARDTNSAEQSGVGFTPPPAAQRPSASASVWRRRVSDIMGTPLTATGAVMGTPAYMSPEQHEGLATDARTDQFSFCVALYEALYGERPFEGGSLAVLASAVIEGRVRSAPEYTQVPSWAREVLLRGLSVDPEARFDSMEALLAALDRVPSRGGRRWAAAAAILVSGGLVAWATFRPEPMRLQAEAGQLASTLAIAELRGRELDAEGHGTPASRHWDALVLAHAREVMDRDPTESLASLRHLTPGDESWVPAARMLAAEAIDRGVAWREAELPDLVQLEITTLGDALLASDGEGRLHHWRFSKDLHRAHAAPGGSVASFALAGTGRVAMVAAGDGALWELKLPDGYWVETGLRTGCQAPELRVDRDAERLVMLCAGRWRRLERGDEGWRDVATPSMDAPILDAAPVEGGVQLLLEADEGVKLVRWTPQTQGVPEAEATVVGARALVSHAGAVSDRPWLRTEAGVYDSGGGKLLRELPKRGVAARGASGLVWSDGQEVVVERGLEGRRLVGHEARVVQVAAAPTQARVVSVDAEGGARVWRTRRGGGRLIAAKGGGVEALDLDGPGGTLFTGARDGRIRRRDLKVGEVGELGKQSSEIRRLVVAPRGDAVATVGESEGVRVWSWPPSDGDAVEVFARERQPARSLAWSHAGDRVAAGSCTTGELCGVYLYERGRGKELAFEGPSRAPRKIAFSPDDTYIAALEPLEEGAAIWIAHAQLGHTGEMHRVDGSFGRAMAMAFGEDGRLWVAWTPTTGAGELVLSVVTTEGRSGELRRVAPAQDVVADDTWVAWRDGARVTLLELGTGVAHVVHDVEGPMTQIQVRRGGTGVALFEAGAEAGEGALLVDFSSHERRRVVFGEGPHAWGQAIVDAPGAYLRIYDDDAPEASEAFVAWVETETMATVAPSRMHRSPLVPPGEDVP